MADLIRSRKVSPVELVQAHLNRIDTLNSKINAYVEVDADRAVVA